MTTHTAITDYYASASLDAGSLLCHRTTDATVYTASASSEMNSGGGVFSAVFANVAAGSYRLKLLSGGEVVATRDVTFAGTNNETVQTGVLAVLDSADKVTLVDLVWDEATSGHTTAGTYGGRIVRATNSNTEVQITGANHIAADVYEFQTGVITAGDFAANSITASALATDAVTEIQSGLATSAALVTLRGADNDTLKTLSDQIDAVSADVSSIASVSREAF